MNGYPHAEPKHLAARSPVSGAPFRIGLRVKVIKRSDNTVSEKCVGKTGHIDYYEYSCGCGQTFPHDPMIGVILDSGEREEFWREEIVPLETD